MLFHPPGFYSPTDWECVISFIEPLIQFALTGQIVKIENLFDEMYLPKNNYAIQIDFTLKPGCIGSISGVEEIQALPYVVSFAQRRFIGSIIHNTGDVRQRFCEIALCVPSVKDMIKAYEKIKSLLKIYDIDGNDMIYEIISPEHIYLKDFNCDN